VLLVIADDFGVDQTLAYVDHDGDGEADDGRSLAPMPHIDALCRQGLRFERAWSAPTCSPTRASMLTGRYGFRTGVGWATAQDNQLSSDEQVLPELLTPLGVSHANIGKWHLGTGNALGGDLAPNTAGWDHFSGSLGGVLSDYASWPRTVDGETAISSSYATSANVDDAMAWLAGTPTDEPWLLWLAFNAPHTPFHLPPVDLHDADDLDPAQAKMNPGPYFRATVQAMDTELGRLLDWLEANGHGPVDVIFLGDNGTPGRVVEPPLDNQHAKGSLYQGGIHVPLCIAGPSLAEPGRSSSALVGTIDVFATILALFGVTLDSLSSDITIDSVNLLPIIESPDAAAPRSFVYTDSFGNLKAGGGERGKAITDGRFKLIVFDNGTRELYDLLADAYESTDLLAASLSPEAQQAEAWLSAQLAALSSE
jgi:arylsulfatase A-like enzyme